ncbi:HD domain-containing protein [Lactobacillus sp. S2-2]|uniref:bis(5'-nucleosyl)-tetraphosphatase (symmetrical) YqeK n=1 Tax=Lactobacillus sp. S2-2 TaxID=2692917 RepID=UPI001F3C9489|nr:bis(5'-nucleosyl)-tetraphosphatase (symmetrical) YqeK [Lactobacillus sp. S2-2]MCF6515142.1 HD domain-containing protein [Lactobacillus sp. S2-2]
MNERYDYKKYSDFDRNQIINKLKNNLTDSRFEHCLRVESEAIRIAINNNYDSELAGLAGLVHDYAKQMSDDKFKQYIREYRLDENLLNYGNEIWHGYVGYLIIQQELGINDSRILNAVRYHTIGSSHMEKLSKIIFMADYIEPNRNFPGVENARKITNSSLDEGVIFQIKNTMIYLVENGNKIYPRALDAYNRIVDLNN